MYLQILMAMAVFICFIHASSKLSKGSDHFSLWWVLASSSHICFWKHFEAHHKTVILLANVKMIIPNLIWWIKHQSQYWLSQGHAKTTLTLYYRMSEETWDDTFFYFPTDNLGMQQLKWHERGRLPSAGKQSHVWNFVNQFGGNSPDVLPSPPFQSANHESIKERATLIWTYCEIMFIFSTNILSFWRPGWIFNVLARKCVIWSFLRRSVVQCQNGFKWPWSGNITIVIHVLCSRWG